eukprot:m51a1_g9469 hypothetical protein (234) ;mRNA; r:572679-573775
MGRYLTRNQVASAVGTCLNTLNYILIGACVLLFIGGIIVFAVGVAAKADQDTADKLNVPGIDSLPPGMIVIGIFICILSIFGIIGAVLWNRPLLAIFTVLLSILVICQLGVGIAGAVEYNKLPKLISTAWDKSSNNTRASLQRQYKCCGYWNNEDRPQRPCPTSKTSNVTYEEGCHDSIYHEIKIVAKPIGGAGIAVSVLEIAGVAITIALMVRVHQVTVQHQRLDDEAPGSL